MTVREKLLKALRRKRSAWPSATQLAREVDEKPSTVSSTLLRMWSDFQVDRQRGKGPRGGYGWHTKIPGLL